MASADHFAVKSVYQALERQPFNLRPSLIYSFQREALQGISAYAGITRPASVEIFGSKHRSRRARISSKSWLKTSATTLTSALGTVVCCPLGSVCNVAT